MEELWELFPISLVPHDERWNEYYREIETKITDLLTGYGKLLQKRKTDS